MVAARPSPVEPDVACDCLSIDRIRRELDTVRVGTQMYLFCEVTSTSDVLRRLAVGGAPDGAVVLAERETGGCPGGARAMPDGVNFYASVLLRPAIPPEAAPMFAFIASLALTDALWAEGVPADIRWPDDVLVEGRKVGGTHVAYAVGDGRLTFVILGVDVNVNADRASLAAALGKEAGATTSLREAAGRVIDRNRFAAAFLNCLEKWMDAYRERGADVVLAARRARDVLTGRRVTIGDDTGAYQACVLGVNRAGRLVVTTEEGEPREVLGGDVQIAEERCA